MAVSDDKTVKCIWDCFHCLFFSLFIPGKVEESQSQDQNLGVGPMETESAKESEKEPEVKTTCKDTNEEVSDETTDKLSENTEDTLPECKPKEMSEVKVEKTNEGEKSLDSNRQSEDNKSFLEQKLSECKSNELSSSNDKPSTLENDQKSSNETSQPLQCEEKESSKSASFVETNCDVTIAGTGIGALSLLMDYQSPVSSPAASPVKEMEFEESVDLTLGTSYKSCYSWVSCDVIIKMLSYLLSCI